MFKKIFSALLLATTMVACTEDYTDWAAPQQNPQPETVTFGNGSVSEVGLIDFANELPANVQVCNITAPTASSEEYRTVIYKLNLGTTSMEIGADGTIPTETLKTYIESTYGKAPTQRDITSTVEQWISNGTTAIKTATSGEFLVKAVLDAPEIYPHMYLIGAPSEWSPTCTTLPFKHDDSKSVYDDPIFTITVPVADGDTWFAFADDKTVETGEWPNVFGAREGNGKNLIGETGYFTRRTDLSDDGSFMISVNGDAKYMKITLNVMDGTYLIEKISFADFIYEIGNNTGWSGVNPLSNNGEGLYTGYCWMDGEYKFKPNADDWVGDWEMVDDLGGNSFTLSDQGNSNFPSLNGFYEMKVDLATNTAQMTEVKSITCVGNHNGWTVNDAAQHMTYNQAEGCWELTTDLKDGFKFAMNDDWSVSWGGANGNPAAYDNLSQNGGKDLETPAGEGTYEIKLYLSCEGKNRVVLTKK